jgi:hypothetical protein
MPVDLLMGNFNALKDDSTDALTMLLGFKTGEIIAKVSDLKLIIKQMTLDAELLAQGVISKSPLEFLKNGPDGLQLNIIKDKVIDPANPAAPPVEVTKILTSEQLAQDCGNTLQINLDGSVEYKPNFCFAAGTLVHTKDGLKPIEQINVGDWVLSKHESGEGEQAYKRITKTFKFDDKPVDCLKYISAPLEKVEHVFVTPNHPFYVKGVGWIQAADVFYPRKLDSYDSTTLDAWECLTLWKTDTPDVAIAIGHGADEGNIVDFREGLASMGAESVSAAVSTYDIFTRTVYNIEVEEFHTYYVGELGVWVHNTNCGGAGDAGRTQKVGVSPEDPAINSIKQGGTVVYGRANGTVSPADLKAPGVILERQYSAAVIDPVTGKPVFNEATAFEQGLLGAYQIKVGVKADGSPRLETPQWSAVFENSDPNGFNTRRFDGRVPSLDMKEWTDTYLDGKLSLGPINIPGAMDGAIKNNIKLDVQVFQK